MKSNSNFNITKVTVDPVSQEITNLEINGKPFESGSEPNLETIVYETNNKLNVSALFPSGSVKPGEVGIEPSEGYDGIERITIQAGGLTGYPLFDPTLLGFVYFSDRPEGLELLQTIQMQNAPADYTYYMVIKYDNESVGYIIVQQIAGESINNPD